MSRASQYKSASSTEDHHEEKYASQDEPFLTDELDIDDISEELVAEFEDAQDELLSEFEEESGDTYRAPALSLKNKLIATSGNFPVSELSCYLDDIWNLPRSGCGSVNNILFNRELEGSNELKRAIVYHTIKEFAPLGNIKSYSTARAQGFNYQILEDYIFKQNYLTAQPEHIKLISLPLIREALKKARHNPVKSHHLFLYQNLRLWIILSDHNLLPKELSIGVTFTEFYTPELQEEVRNRYFRGSISTWIPYSEEELETLVEYSLFWIEDGAPEIHTLRNYLIDTGFSELADGIATRVQPLVEFKKLTNVKIKNKIVIENKILRRYKNGTRLYSHSWMTQYGLALDNIRNAIFILIAFITGARKSELATLKFSDLNLDENDEYWLTIRRFKTAKSSVTGEIDELPIPKFIGDAIRSFEILRDIGPFKKRGWLFQSNMSTKTLNKPTPAIVQMLIDSLRRTLPIERIHCHRFRKTIAEILINRDERNVDIIRALFGHKSYSMTLQYIARNPLMVRTVALALEHNYTRDFHEIVAGIRFGGYSGEAAKRISAQINKRRGEFTGQQLKVSLMSYISHLLAAGEQIFIRRIAIGTFCLSGENYSAKNLPPCLTGRKTVSADYQPDPSNCQVDCRKIIILESSKQALMDNITFYSKLLDTARGKLSPTAERELNRRIAATEIHLNNITITGGIDKNFIEVLNV
ncbi:tyrosine-type recombinase/integrase [Pseudomonas yamanorum]|uniref:tyrosine-type recombinase/integrase n=1 Tax=Pseudomonas yamanorum TaxID=515393 RepID=UPI003F74FD7C